MNALDETLRKLRPTDLEHIITTNADENISPDTLRQRIRQLGPYAVMRVISRWVQEAGDKDLSDGNWPIIDQTATSRTHEVQGWLQKIGATAVKTFAEVSGNSIPEGPDVRYPISEAESGDRQVIARLALDDTAPSPGLRLTHLTIVGHELSVNTTEL